MRRKYIYKVMSVLFLLILLVPNAGLFREKRNTELITEMENRSIAPFPKWDGDCRPFFRGFEKWYDDRLLGRKELIRFWAGLNGRLFHVLISKEVALGKDGYLFMPFHLNHSLEDPDRKVAQLVKLNQACSEAGARLTVFFAPNSEWILGEMLPEKYTPTAVEKLERETGELFRENHIDYCFVGSDFLKMPLEQRKKLYLKGDYHWTYQGAYLATKALLRHLKLNDKIDYPMVYHKEKGMGDIYTRKIGLKPIWSDEDVPWNEAYTRDVKVRMRIAGEIIEKEDSAQKGEMILTNPAARYQETVLVLGDSFFGSMRPYLMQDFGKVVYVHNIDIRNPKKDIDIHYLLETYKPKIVIYEKMASFFFGHNYDSVFGTWRL